MSNQIASQAFENNEEDDFKWTHSANWLLINSYLELRHEFRNPAVKKKDLWMQISDKFRDAGHEVSFDLLDKKFRNLKATYYQVKERKEKTNKKIKWEYYKAFDILISGDEAAVSSNSQSAKTPTPSDDPRLAKFPSTVYTPMTKKRKRSLSAKPSPFKKTTNITIEPATNDFEDEGSVDTSKEKNSEYDLYDVITEENQEGEYEYNIYNVNSNEQATSTDKTVDLKKLEAGKILAETRFFHKKADYFEKQTIILDVQQKLMMMQAIKLKDEIEHIRSERGS